MNGAPLQGYFDALYAQGADPYGTQHRWYEQRKRALLLASLPRRRFRHCYEPGCGAGALTAQLAERCDAVLASDFSAPGLDAVRTRLAALPQVRCERHVLPRDWPRAQRFDLVVLSEVLYFLPLAQVHDIARACELVLDDDGVLVACDWRAPFDARASETHEVHAALAAIGLPALLAHEEDDFALRVWARDPRSVAQREGIR